MARFYGDKKIDRTEEDGEHIILHFSDGTFARVSKKMHEISLTKKSTDLTALWDKQMAAVSAKTLAIWLEWDVKLSQIEYLFNILKSSIEHNLKKADDIAWGINQEDRTVSNVDDVLNKAKKDEQN